MSLEKLTIQAYTDPSRSDMFPETFEAMFNPESYSLNYANKYTEQQGINSSGKEAGYAFTRPEKLSLKLILDGTGVREYGAEKLYNLTMGTEDDVYTLVHEFLQMTSYMDGTIHEPKFLKLMWGDLTFNCRLGSVNVTYTLFNRSGQPTRAELDTSFIGDIVESDRLKLENKQSPDLTHAREVTHGDSLSLMVKNIYKTPDHYIHVARANKLKSLRDLSVGDEIYFPPIEK